MEKGDLNGEERDETSEVGRNLFGCCGFNVRKGVKEAEGEGGETTPRTGRRVEANPTGKGKQPKAQASPCNKPNEETPKKTFAFPTRNVETKGPGTKR